MASSSASTSLPSLPSAPPPSSSRSSPDIPPMWRNHTLNARHRQRASPALFDDREDTLHNDLFNSQETTRTENSGVAFNVELRILVTAPQGASRVRFVEHNADRPSQQHDYYYVAPRPATPVTPRSGINAQENWAATVHEAAMYPPYRAYDRLEVVAAAKDWVQSLERLLLDFRGHFNAQFNFFKRCSLVEYRKLIRRLARIVALVRQMISLLEIVASFPDPEQCDLHNESIEIPRVMEGWIGKATRLAEPLLVLFGEAQKYAMMEMAGRVMDLADELKTGALDRIVEVVARLKPWVKDKVKERDKEK